MVRVYTYSTSYGSSRKPPNPLMRLLAGVVSVVLLIGAAFLGLFIFLIALGVVAVAGAVMAVRFWLFRRQVEAALRKGAPQDPRNKGYIDAEYEER